MIPPFFRYLRPLRNAFPTVAAWLIPCSIALAQDSAKPPLKDALKDALAFHAGFDTGPDASFARGDQALYHAPAMDKRQNAVPGLPPGGEVSIAAQSGRFGGALRFTQSKGPMVFFKGGKNLPPLSPGWSGTVCFWLNTDPVKDLPEGFCDPFQVTAKQWDDASIFVEFEKRPSGIPFRLGVYADKNVWNPTGRKFEEIPPAERPVAAVENPPFSAGKWTHVGITFKGFNTGKPEGTALLFLDGQQAAAISPRTQSFTWEAGREAIMLGLSYIGLMDDLAIFDRALDLEEIQQVFSLKTGVAELRKAPGAK